MRTRERARAGGPLLASVALHAALLGGMVAFGGGAPELPPRAKVYAVNIVSPPPTELGEPMDAPPATQEPGEAGPAASASESPAPEPTPPAPDPVPAPPAPKPAPPTPAPEKSAPREPAKAPEPRRTPERPASTPTRPSTPPRTSPATPEKGRTPATTGRTPSNPTTPRGSGSTAQTGRGSDAARTTGEGTRTGPATGRNPDPNGAGGEGLNVRTEGARCPSPGYCENIVRQVRRFFRAPESAAGGSGNVCFRIQRDGSVSRITTERVRGGSVFRIALIEAAEQAGTRKAFGALPAAFATDELPVCVDITPSIAQ